ncbi:MAG: tetratricopeptide repeat protein [Sediminispirochaetaceae bacterium]
MKPVFTVFLRVMVIILFGTSMMLHGQASESGKAATVDLKEQALKLFMDNKPAEALPLFENALRQSPEEGELYMYLATCYEQMGNIEASIRTYEQGLKHAGSQEAVFYYNLGNNYNRLENYERSLEMYNQAVRRNNQLARAYLNRANVLVRQGECTQAIADYRVYLTLEPDSSQRENIEKMISLLNNKIVLAERQRQEEERRRREEEQRQQELLEQVLNSLEESGEETKNLSAGTGDVKEYSQDFDIVD